MAEWPRCLYCGERFDARLIDSKDKAWTFVSYEVFCCEECTTGWWNAVDEAWHAKRFGRLLGMPSELANGTLEKDVDSE